MWKRFIKWQYNYNFPVIKDPIVETKEKYYNNKYPKKNIAYKRTDRNGTIRIDVRQFLNHHNYKLMEIVGADDDEIAYESLMYVMDNIKYTPDKSQYGMNEYWCFNYETLNSKKGDCEDGAILLYSLMRKNGIPAWKIRLNAGLVGTGTNSFKKVEDIDILWYSQKVIDYGIIPKVLLQESKKANESVNLQNLEKALSLLIKEKGNVESPFVNMVGKLLKIENKFVKSVEKMIRENSIYTTQIKIDKTTLQKIYEYYVILAIHDSIVKKETQGNSKKDINLGTSGFSGHAYVVYYVESKKKWVILDWCYWPNRLSVNKRKEYKKEKNYHDVWFSWNEDYAWSEGLNKKAEELLKS